MKEKRFSKAKWLASANKQIAEGTLTEQERDDAVEIWVNLFDGKTEYELDQMGQGDINPEWFE